MITRIKYLLIGSIVGLLLGLWFGINLGTGKPIYANPFAERSVTERLSEGAEDALEEGKRSLGKALE